MSNPDSSSNKIKREISDDLKHINEKYETELKRIKTERDQQRLALSTNSETLNKYNELKEQLANLKKQNEEQIRLMTEEIVTLEDQIYSDRCTICDRYIPIRLMKKCQSTHYFCVSHGVSECMYNFDGECRLLCPLHTHTAYLRSETITTCEFHKRCYNTYRIEN